MLTATTGGGFSQIQTLVKKMPDVAEVFNNEDLQSQDPFIWSRVPETALPSPSYPGRANFSLISLKTSSNRLHKNRELVSGTRQLGWASCLTLAGRVTLSGNFFSL